MALFKILFFLFTLLLIGCGGGGGNSDNASTSTEPDTNIPIDNITIDPLKKFIETKAAYIGNAEKSSINTDELGRFFGYFFFIAEDLNPSYLASNNSDDICIDGGSATISDTDKLEEKTIVFNNCIDGNLNFDGNATLRVELSSLGEELSSTIIFEEVVTNTSFGDFTLSGTMKGIVTNSYGPTTLDTFNFILTNADGRQVLFENFILNNNGFEDISTTGLIYDSRLGYLQFETTEIFEGKNTGELTIKGRDNDLAVWTVRRSDENRNNTAIIKHDINIYESQTETTTNYRYLGSYMTEELLLSFADNDNDGIQDSWEVLFGLDPTNSDDAYLDNDLDGYSNQMEFLYRGTPNNNEIIPEISDIASFLTHETKTYSDDIPLSLTIRNYSDSTANNVIATLTALPPLKFIDDQNSCEVSEDALLMTCSYSLIAKGNTFRADYSLTADSSVVDEILSLVSVELKSESFDPQLNNNISTLYVTRPKLEFSYSVYIEEEESISYYTLLNEGESQEYQITYIPGSGIEISNDYLKSATLEFETSDSIEMVSGQCLINSIWTDCLNNRSFDINDALREGILHVKFTMKGNVNGHSFVTFKLTDSITGQRAYQDIVFPVIVGQPTSYIQEKIDNATDGEDVFVEQGIYIGGLNLDNKKINLISIQGAENTYLYRHKDSFDDAITIGNDSSLSGFSIIQMSIFVKDGGALMSDNIFSVPFYGLYSSKVVAKSTLDFTHNIINAETMYASFGSGNELSINSCFSIIADGGILSTVHVNAENNLYTSTVNDTGCSFFEVNGGNIVYMANNTVNGLNQLLSLSEKRLYDLDNNLTLDRKFTVELENNIISNTSHLMYFDNTRDGNIFTFDDESTFLLKNNLVYNVDTDLTLRVTDSINIDDFWTEEARLTLDPLFNTDWTLQFNSPAIDAGISNQLTTDLNNNLRPVDGNNDGVAEIDIGAYEYKLN